MARRTSLLVVAGLVVLTSACGPDGGTTPATDDAPAPSTSTPATDLSPSTPAPPTAPPSEVPVTTPPPPTPTRTPTPTPTPDACQPGTAAGSDEAAARCLYAAFRDADRERAAAWATPTALDALFALGGYPTDDAWSFEGCGAPRETRPSSGVSCRFTIPGEVHGVAVELALREDHVVEAVQSIG